MKCPYCGCADTKVLDSRSLEKKKRRRRECPSCLKRFTTYEVLDVPLLMVKKKDGSFEPFDKNKLIKGIYSAIKKRPVSVEDVTKIVSDIETSFANDMKNQITTAEIGDIVLEKMKDLDAIAYIRFASVYKEFTDKESFIKIISELDTK
ncbi:MAG: transcriptional repressor NrdR [Oscillospiraceae bacterium]|nr:transcriptional repressor NrdR [Oscillospiraceae bacterium]MBP1591326.1 transcriptional repressor NrdR [Oscillospiraceae bacterium]MBR3024088.1 transcriptional repressor NrdR [Oscillospiraceae bacterium]MBR3536916.1 transcriptional repressor NrdR [Oscillospiraceae bacterium]